MPYEGFLISQEDMGSHLHFTAGDVMMLGMTLYHQGGFGMGLQMTLKGGTVLYQPQFNPVTFLETVQKYHISVIQLTSTLAKVLLSTPDFDKYDLSSVRVCYFAGEVLPKELADIFVHRLGIRVINVIGSSETAVRSGLPHYGNLSAEHSPVPGGIHQHRWGDFSPAER